MVINKLISSREFIYHLTSRENLDSILDHGIIYSTNRIIEHAELTPQEKESTVSERRPGHLFVNSMGNEMMIRDQRPISIKSLNKCLLGGITAGEFISHLNDRVFFWPTLKRLNIHFERYKNEQPKIIRLQTSDVIQINEESLRLCRWNSGATRCLPHYGGAPPPRGLESFMKLDDYDLSVGSIAEVTFEKQCILPDRIWVADSPNGPWEEL